MAGKLDGKKVAIIATDGFEESELTEPRKALEQAGARVEVVSLERGRIRGNRHFERGLEVPVDRTIDEARPEAYDALVLPGGLFNPDKLRTDQRVTGFVRTFFESGKPLGAICHGPQVLIDAGVVEGRKLTSVRSIATDLKNAGALWQDTEVVVDQGLVTSRTPDDLPAFCRKLVEEIGEGRHAPRARSAA